MMIRCLRPFGYKMLLFAFHNPPAGLTSSIDDISSNSRPSRLPGFYNSQSHLLNRLSCIRHGPFFSFPYSRCCCPQRHNFHCCSYPRWRTSHVRQVLTLKIQHITRLTDGPWSSLREELARQLATLWMQPKTSDLILALTSIALTNSL